MELKNLSTGSGDGGFSSLKDGRKIRKDSIVFEALGSLDKTCSYLGLIKSKIEKQELKKHLTYIQGLMYKIGSTIADSSESLKQGFEKALSKKLGKIEQFESELLKKTHIKNVLVIPGKNQISAQIDIARTLCREFERRLIKYIYREKHKHLKVFVPIVNRIGDYLYILARYSEEHIL